jgi:hypothetical protein
MMAMTTSNSMRVKANVERLAWRCDAGTAAEIRSRSAEDRSTTFTHASNWYFISPRRAAIRFQNNSSANFPKSLF